MILQIFVICSGVLVVVLMLGLFGCRGQDWVVVVVIIDKDFWLEVIWLLVVDLVLEKCIIDLMVGMMVEEKVGQLVQGDIVSVIFDDVCCYWFGLILVGGNFDFGGCYDVLLVEWLVLVDVFYDVFMDILKGGKVILLLFGIDVVYGQSNIVGVMLFLYNIGLGVMCNLELLWQIGGIIVLEICVIGMEWMFVLIVVVFQDDCWGCIYEGYFELLDVVVSYVVVMVEGLQGRVGILEFFDGCYVIVLVKYFLGDGGIIDGKDQGDICISELDLVCIYVVGYLLVIVVGVQIVMVLFNSVNGEKMYGYWYYFIDVFKGCMNFGGFVVGDWNGYGQVKGCIIIDCLVIIIVGLDMVMVLDSWKGFYEMMLVVVKDGWIML